MAYKELIFDDIVAAIGVQSKNYNKEKIKLAYDFAEDAHKGQKRKSGERFFNHPCSCAVILIDLGMDTDTIIAALLHDVVEDTEVTAELIKEKFGDDVAMLVTSVTKLRKIPFISNEEAQAENIRKMLIAMSEDIRVIIIKLADRLHNMRTISGHEESKQREISRETLEIYAPIAHRLGIRGIKEELEDLAIHYLDPVAYSDIEQLLDSKKQHREEFLKTIIERIENRLGSAVKDIKLEGRVKSIHGIYRKMYMQGRAFEEIYDIYAVRIITDTVVNCYNILGFIHDMFRPIPGRFKDYISTPKPNMYQSLHTTLISREGLPFEVQIRTWDMHRTAEYGIAAHWKYKEGVSKNDSKMEERLSWIRQILETQQESDDAEEIVRTIKSDLTQDNIFTVTPKGDVISLPTGSCVIDFAYAIHSAIGNRMIGAKVDGRIVPFDYKLKNGEIIEILTTSQPHGPSRDWLKIVKTSEARNKIRQWFKKERRTENVEQGKQEIDREFRRNLIHLSTEEYAELIKKLTERTHCKTIDDFYAAIGYGGVIVSKLMPKIKEEIRLSKKGNEIDIDEYIAKRNAGRNKAGIEVEGIDNCLIKLSKCCNPLPGDAILGYITRGHGVSVHKRDCTNVPRDLTDANESERWIEVRWTGKQDESFKTTLRINAIDRSKLLADVTTTLANMRLMVHNLNARELKDGNCEIMLTLSIDSLEHLKNITGRLSKVKGVYFVERSIV